MKYLTPKHHYKLTQLTAETNSLSYSDLPYPTKTNMSSIQVLIIKILYFLSGMTNWTKWIMLTISAISGHKWTESMYLGVELHNFCAIRKM